MALGRRWRAGLALRRRPGRAGIATLLLLVALHRLGRVGHWWLLALVGRLLRLRRRHALGLPRLLLRLLPLRLGGGAGRSLVVRAGRVFEARLGLSEGDLVAVVQLALPLHSVSVDEGAVEATQVA